MISNHHMLNRRCPVLVQSIRAFRKPIWMPVAKSKIFRIPKQPVIPEEERLELMRVNKNYKTQMRAIRWFYHDEMIREKSTFESASSAMSQRVEAEEWERATAENDRWNAQVATEREERRRKELDQMQEYILKRMEDKDRQKNEKIAIASEKIRQLKEQSYTFVTPELLESAIDHALANPVDYNFAIDPRNAADHVVSGKPSDKSPTASET